MNNPSSSNCMLCCWRRHFATQWNDVDKFTAVKICVNKLLFPIVTIHGFSQLELFLVIQTFPSLQTAMTDGAVFWGYGAVCLIGVVFTLMFVPETKDKVNIVKVFVSYFNYFEWSSTMVGISESFSFAFCIMVDTKFQIFPLLCFGLMRICSMSAVGAIRK